MTEREQRAREMWSNTIFPDKGLSLDEKSILFAIYFANEEIKFEQRRKLIEALKVKYQLLLGPR